MCVLETISCYLQVGLSQEFDMSLFVFGVESFLGVLYSDSVKHAPNKTYEINHRRDIWHQCQNTLFVSVVRIK